MTSAYLYDLPPERIAQRPVLPYDSAKLLLVDREGGALSERQFKDLPNSVGAADLFVFNNTKVLPARLFGRFDGGGGMEVLLVRRESDVRWICLGKPLKKFRDGRVLRFEHGLEARVLQRIGEQQVLLQFSTNEAASAEALLRKSGVMPIPPYIRGGVADQKDSSDYQTFFAEHEGSVAAPTASLHFTPELVRALKEKGCGIEFVTLHLGTASFLPLWNEGQEPGQTLTPPGEERGFFDAAAYRRIVGHKERGGRVIAVGTSAVRLVESAVRLASVPESGIVEVKTDLFIQPGFEFRVVDALVTNFHQPRTTHLLLVEAFMGRDLLSQSYDFALGNEFRFLSYGDGMFISGRRR